MWKDLRTYPKWSREQGNRYDGYKDSSLQLCVGCAASQKTEARKPTRWNKTLTKTPHYDNKSLSAKTGTRRI